MSATTANNPAPATGAEARAIPYYRPGFNVGFLAPRYWGTWLLLGFFRLGSLLPLAVAQAIGAALGEIYFLANAKRRHIARTNIRLCFAELSATERERLVRRHFRVMGQATFGVGLLWWGSRRRLERLIRMPGGADLRARLDRGERVILLTAHFVALEAGGNQMSRVRDGGVTMMKAVHNPLLNWFVTTGRMRFGGRMLLREQGWRPLIRSIREEQLFYYLPDEDFGPEQSVFVPFFGIPTATITTLGRLARLTDAVVIPCFPRLLPGGRGYEVILDPPLENFPTGDEVEDARRMNAALESGIRRMPEQYLWTFKWFKTRPDHGPSPYD